MTAAGFSTPLISTPVRASARSGPTDAIPIEDAMCLQRLRHPHILSVIEAALSQTKLGLELENPPHPWLPDGGFACRGAPRWNTSVFLLEVHILQGFLSPFKLFEFFVDPFSKPPLGLPFKHSYTTHSRGNCFAQCHFHGPRFP